MISKEALADWLKVAREIGERGEAKGDAISAILALDAENRQLRDLIRRALAAGVNWDFGGDLRADAEAIVGTGEDV